MTQSYVVLEEREDDDSEVWRVGYPTVHVAKEAMLNNVLTEENKAEGLKILQEFDTGYEFFYDVPMNVHREPFMSCTAVPVIVRPTVHEYYVQRFGDYGRGRMVISYEPLEDSPELKERIDMMANVFLEMTTDSERHAVARICHRLCTQLLKAGEE